MKNNFAAYPRYIRPPVRGREYFTGFSRSKLYALEAAGLIKSARIGGVKLFDLQSIYRYIETKAAEQESALVA